MGVRTPRAIVEALLEQSGGAFVVQEGARIEKDLISAAKKIKHCGDYGRLFYHPGKREVHWTAGDADGPPDYTSADEIVKLLKLPGVKHVEIGDEWSPDEAEGWKRLDEVEASNAVNSLLEDDDFDLEAEFEQLSDARRVARWPFAQSELKQPETARSTDWHFAVYIDQDGYYAPVLIPVRRDLRVHAENKKYELDFDRLVAVRRPVDFGALIADREPVIWRDVYVRNGRFAGFVRPEGTE